jgi:hypothetical protein
MGLKKSKSLNLQQQSRELTVETSCTPPARSYHYYSTDEQLADDEDEDYIHFTHFNTAAAANASSSSVHRSHRRLLPSLSSSTLEGHGRVVDSLRFVSFETLFPTYLLTYCNFRV